MSVRSVSAQDLQELLLSGLPHIVVHFWATWAPQCAQMNDVMEELATEHPAVSFVKLEAEAVPELALKHNVNAVPTFIFFKAGQPVERLDGAHAPELVRKVQQLAASLPPPHAAPTTAVAKAPSADLKERLHTLVRAAPCMLFIKGTSKEPRCGFSRQTVEILNQHGAKFSSFDILSDEAVRQGLKEFSNWPTYPQLYVNGNLIGGLDIIKELAETGELDKMLPKEESLEDRLKSLINKAPVMLFMKGNKETPRCGFSRSIVNILNDNGVKYETFDILQDEEVRQGLKTFSNWPTYPQLYACGELVGGLDIVKELLESGELLSTLQAPK